MNASAFPITESPTRHGWAGFLLVIVSLAMFLPGFASLPPMDRDEPRFAQASKQMLETGDFVSIRYQSEARNKKPVGIYWMQAAAVALGSSLGVDDARRTIWLYRLPSLLGAILTVLGTYWAALALTTQRGAFIAALFMASTVLLAVEAHLAKTDAMLAATVVFVMGGLARVYLGFRSPIPRFGGVAAIEPRSALLVPALFWTALAVGILIKGPITPMVPAFAIIVLCVKDGSGSWLRALKPGLGLLWTLMLVLPWFVMILLRTRGAFLADSLGHDMLGKVAGVQEAHGAPPGTYLAVFWATAWPMAPFVALAAPTAWRLRREPRIAFLLAWIIPVWLLFEAVPTKLPHYVLPVYPALAILAAIGLIYRSERRDGRSRWQAGVVFGLTAVLPAALGAVLAAGRGRLWDDLPPWAAGFGTAVVVALLVVAAWAAYSITHRDVVRVVLASTAAALLAYLFIFGQLLTPGVADRLALSRGLAWAGREALTSDCPDGRLAAAGDHEPSLVFLTATDLLLTDGPGAAAFLNAGDCRAAFVEARVEPAFSAALDGSAGVRLAQRVTGTAINGGKALDIAVYVRQRQRP